MPESDLFMKALQSIARQKLSSELGAEGYSDPDYETGYDDCIKTARVVLDFAKEAPDV